MQRVAAAGSRARDGKVGRWLRLHVRQASKGAAKGCRAREPGACVQTRRRGNEQRWVPTAGLGSSGASYHARTGKAGEENAAALRLSIPGPGSRVGRTANLAAEAAASRGECGL